MSIRGDDDDRFPSLTSSGIQIIHSWTAGDKKPCSLHDSTRASSAPCEDVDVQAFV
jgi:hypothetical protein